MEKTLPLNECSIGKLYLDSEEPVTYTIPIYQRNYAWKEEEISDLIKDVHDSFKNKKEVYYIGTLVTYKRGDNLFEVIDGQQRLTTIYIILKVLDVKNLRNKLTYGARKVSASTIQKLGDYPNLGDEVDSGIRDGYKYAKNALDNANISEDERKEFTEYFLNKVHIIHYKVPKDVDLNHYFEVMNSRGEQLEKHEIVKSLLSQHLKDKAELATFSRVWEACSEMNIYIQQTLANKLVFGDHLCQFIIGDFNDIPKVDQSEGKNTILDLLKQPITKLDDKTSKDQNDKFQPIIDFPNFLLIVLKLTRMGAVNFDPVSFVLDDKELLREFNEVLNGLNENEKADFARLFGFNLLKAKYLLDNYMIHHSLNDKELAGDNPWKLQYYYHESSKKTYPKNLSSMLQIQDEMVHLLSMFEVAFTPRQRKNYLFYCLLYLFTHNEHDDQGYLEFLRNLANKYFYNVYLNKDCLTERNQPKPNAFDNALLKNGALNTEKAEYASDNYRAKFTEIYQQGRMDIPLFVFNYTDYMLWKKYADVLRGNKTKKGEKERNLFFDELGCSDFELDVFNNFYFSRTRKSLEHYYPQAKAGEGKELSSEQINCFGNFAMIGAEANSSGSNWDPKTKLDHYSDRKSDPVSVASLKFRIMMQKCQDNDFKIRTQELERKDGMEWNYEDMQEHQEKILKIIIPFDAPNNSIINTSLKPLGSIESSYGFWSEDEVAALRDMVKDGSSFQDILNAFKNRSMWAIILKTRAISVLGSVKSQNSAFQDRKKNQMLTKREVYPDANRVWEYGDITKLKRMVLQPMSMEDICAELGRTNNAIISQLSKLYPTFVDKENLFAAICKYVKLKPIK